jgi:glutathionyl-hydroquinone reductase
MRLISCKTCPLAHCVEIMRILAGLENAVEIIFVDPVITFSQG